MTVELTVLLTSHSPLGGESFFTTARGKDVFTALEAVVAFLKDGWEDWSADVRLPDGSSLTVDHTGWTSDF